MRAWTIAVVSVVLLSACSPTSPGSSASPQPSATASPSNVSGSRTPSPVPADRLPISYPITDSLTSGGAGSVVSRLHEVAGGLPVLKVDLTAKRATLTALLPDRSVVSYRWEDGQINRVDSDIQYLEQATFDPAAFPIDSLGRMFDIADLRGVRGELVLQIVEYRQGQVVMTVTSRPESKTVFFHSDGTAVASLGLSSVADITEGLSEVIGDATEAYSVVLSPTLGYSADLPDTAQGVVLNRTRPAEMPPYETRRSESPSLTPFNPALIRPEALAKAIARSQQAPGEACTVTIDMSQQRSAPVAKIGCGATTTYADMDGRDMTKLIG